MVVKSWTQLSDFNFTFFLEGLVGLHRTANFSFFGISGWGIDLIYCDVEWFALAINRDLSVIVYPSTAFWTPLLTMMAIPYLLRDS